ncbi:adenylate/guanylate cyclase domain-containing protein [Bradyrhizobium sp. AUGA SZCCT0169]|jgi:adenylate cyclase|uniref:adenylate/guanylate cyclase domain-containing protein n=1 Tax=unclassified Bradyrhizobium TaxID=2631580 RepID=UPI001BABC2ED|nr:MULTISPECIES: adenylate/guanylate cyclase domain-containing protein [unclassified Bradyrhizobium]MBR1238862.1 adenylate/guanylate cyclase domain-containing protein [Bradyrhizobium sp. AUGA SZCCT0274]MBR1248778.1 adenylate/guanylate cyclase domain-containing protein [Bradyrhizobium sp. AUGA SZCCT0169]
MFGFWGNTSEKPVVSADFQRALTQQILRTELIRIKALIGTTVLIGVLILIVHALDPDAIQKLWHGRFDPSELFIVLVPFVLFELWVHFVITRHLGTDHDLPVYRRYIGALVETSMPTLALAMHIDSMGPVDALGFAVPLTYFIFVILSTLRLDFWLSTFTGFVAAAQLLAMAMLYHRAGSADPPPDLYYHSVRSVIILICGMLAGAVGVQLRRQFEASILAATARDRITNLFGQHVSPQVVERLMAEGAATGSEVRRVAVMFVDFRSFTAGASTRTPQEVVDRLDGAFAVLVDILDRHGGIVNKFLGDGFLALFGAPFDAGNAAHRAVAAAREMLEANERANQASSWPLRIGIGIHVGEVVAGNIGSPRRKEYTVIGDTVNFASRLEALNKDFNSQFLISAAVHDALGEECRDAVALGEVPVRGYERPVTVWKVA